MSHLSKSSRPLPPVKPNTQERKRSNGKTKPSKQETGNQGNMIPDDHAPIRLPENIQSPDFLQIKDLTDIDKLQSLIPGLIESKMAAVARAVSRGEYTGKEFQEATHFLPMMYASWKGLPGRQELKKICAESLALHDCCAKFLAAIKAMRAAPDARDEVSHQFKAEYWQSYRSMWDICWNVTDSSEVFAENLCSTEGFLQLIWIILSTSKDEHLKQTQTAQDERINIVCLGIIYNCCLYDSTRETITGGDFVPVLYPYLLSFKDPFKSTALLAMAYLLDEKQSARFLADSSQLKFLITLLEGAADSTERRSKGWTSDGLLKGVARIALNDANKKGLVKGGILQVLLKLTESPHIWEQRGATEILWLLAYDDYNKNRIVEESGMVDMIHRLTESPDDTVKRHANGALWVLRNMLSVLRKAAKFERPTVNADKRDVKDHVMISYNWSDQPILVQVKERLTSRGYRVWMDIDNMHGSTLQAMAEAVESSSVFVVCLSQNYKNSPNCRAEAEYAYQLRKNIVPLKTKTNYTPDGWLGMLVGTKLFFDFSDKYRFDNKMEELVRELSLVRRSDGGSESSGKNVVKTTRLQGSTPSERRARENLLETHHIQSEKVWSLRESELRFLVGLRKEAPEFFYHCLETRLGIFEIEDILNFTNFLEEL